MKRGGAVMLGKANLDEFPFGDFGISTVGGTVGNAYDPSLSTAGSSGGSATAVATSLVPLGVRHRHVQLAVEPGGVRVARHDPHDARADQPRRRDAAQHLQRRGRPDGEVGARRRAGARSGRRRRPGGSGRPRTPRRHITGSFAAGLDADALKGTRIGVLRQRFVGFTGEREVADDMDTVIKELQAAGATVVDVAIPGLRREVRGRREAVAPGSLEAGWIAVSLARREAGRQGAHASRICSRRASWRPVSARRLEGALAPAPTGDALDEATKRIHRRPRDLPRSSSSI